MKISFFLIPFLFTVAGCFREKYATPKVVLDFSGIETFVSLAQQAKPDTTTLDSLLRMEPYQKTKEWLAKRLGFQEHDLKTLYYHALFPERYQLGPIHNRGDFVPERSEERRVGKECRSRWSRDH